MLKHCYSRHSYRDLCVCCWFGIDELSPEAPWPLIQSACLHIHCFLALMYYRVQVVVCAVTARIKLCHSHFTAAAVLFSGRSETLRGEGISLICQLWSFYLTVDWVRQDEGRLDFIMHTHRKRGQRQRPSNTKGFHNKGLQYLYWAVTAKLENTSGISYCH